MITKLICNVHSTTIKLFDSLTLNPGSINTGLPTIIVLSQTADIKRGTLVSCLYPESHDYTTYLMLSEVDNWFLTLSQKVKLHTIFAGISRVHYNLDSKLNLMPSGHIWVNLVKVWIANSQYCLHSFNHVFGIFTVPVLKIWDFKYP